jgi:hypothetical protein
MATKLAKISDLTTGYQPLDSELTALAGLTSAANQIPYFTGSGTAGLLPSTSTGRGLLNVADGAAILTAIGDAELSALAGLTSAADALPYFTGVGTASTTTLSSFMRSVLDDTSAATAASTLSVLPLTGGTLIGALILAADPVTALGAATKQYVDNLSIGLDAKQSVVAATAAGVNVANLGTVGPQTIDGISVIAGDRVLLKSQTAPAENGIYVVNAGSLTRATDADAWTELPGAFVFVERGTTNADTGWLCTVDQGGTINTNAVTFVQFSGGGSITAGSGIAISGTQVSLAAIAANSFLANNTGSSAVPSAITVAQAKTLLNYVVGDIPTAAPLASPTFTGTASVSGTVPALGTNTTQIATTAFVEASSRAASVYLTGSNATGNTTITPVITARAANYTLDVTGTASTRIAILDITNRVAGDKIALRVTLPAVASIVVESRNATSGGTLLDSITTDASGDDAFMTFVYSGSAWVLQSTQYPA